jgi:hypothetical protein
MFKNTFTLVALTGLGLFAGSGAALAQPSRFHGHGHHDHHGQHWLDYHNIDRLALQLQRQVRGLHSEADHHFRRTPQYRHLHEDIEKVEHLARHIHEFAHRQAGLAHIRSDVRELDSLFHHIFEVVDQMRHCHDLDWRAYRHFRTELQGVSYTLHRLQRELR